MGDHHEARMFHDQTYLTSGWHVGMCIMAKNGDPHELESVWSYRLVSSPNPSYQVKLGEGPSSIGNQWAGFTLVHYAVWRYYNNQTGADSAARGVHLTNHCVARNQPAFGARAPVVAENGVANGGDQIHNEYAVFRPEHAYPELILYYRV